MSRNGASDDRERSAALADTARARWPAFWAVVSAYLAVTVAESILAPVLPVVAQDLGLDLRTAGVALGSLTGAIAVGNLAGGALVTRAGSRVALATGLGLCAAGCAVVAGSGSLAAFITGQVLIGLGGGSFFPAGLQAAGHHAGTRRRGLAMGLFGVAFSGGLTIAALLAVLGAELDWRAAFAIAAGLCLVGTAVIVRTPLPPRPRLSGRSVPLRRVLGAPMLTGAVAAVAQYGTVAFLPTFAVVSWGLAPAAAALMLAAARALSVAAKLLAGAAADRWGPGRALVGLGVLLTSTGLAWTMLPPGPHVVAAAVVFAAAVSGVFPIANLIALEGFGERGGLVGAFRSAQIAAGAAGAWVVGALAQQVGLGPALAGSVLLPVLLVVLGARGAAQGGKAAS